MADHFDHDAVLRSAIDCLRDIAAMGKKAGSETARNWLIRYGYPMEDGGYVPGKGFRTSGGLHTEQRIRAMKINIRYAHAMTFDEFKAEAARRGLDVIEYFHTGSGLWAAIRGRLDNIEGSWSAGSGRFKALESASETVDKVETL